MKYLDLTFPTPAENLACDEALLEACEAGSEGEILRFWEPLDTFIVVGYANKVATEVNLTACQAHSIPVLRRLSGGGTVLQGPGCLNYSLILRITESGPLSNIAGTNTFILERQKAALEPLMRKTVQLEGQTDLALGNLKFSGNAQRRKHNFLIFHGTLLLNLDLSLIEKFLLMPSKQPDYRRNRRHEEFLMNLQLSPETVKQAIRKQWQATEASPDVSLESVSKLVSEKYATDVWNNKF